MKYFHKRSCSAVKDEQELLMLCKKDPKVFKNTQEVICFEHISTPTGTV